MTYLIGKSQMTTSTIVKKRNVKIQLPSDAVSWLGLAASPTFALMAWMSVNDLQILYCSSAPRLLPIGGMAWMYLLMSIFHASPWLRLFFDRPKRLTHLPTDTEGE